MERADSHMARQRIKRRLSKFKAFNIVDVTAALWVFRKYTEGDRVRYTAKWVDATNSLIESLTSVVATYQNSLAEEVEYAILAEIGDSQVFHIAADQTHISLLIEMVNQPKQDNQVGTERELENIAGYVLHLNNGQDDLYCVKKATSSWSTKESRNVLNVIFREKELELLEDPAFKLEKTFDLFLIDGDLLVPNKRAFESLLSYKQDFIISFNDLLATPAFSNLFSTTETIVEYVGTNSIHLRRMTAIREKGFYADAAFMSRLKTENGKRNWGITFNKVGKIVPSEETMNVIMNVFLDHRLTSLLTRTTYDVPSTVVVVV